ncbi:hypothetical protein A4S05_35480 [Nostoc sp. KVJ20]|uniref:hypothetical protein n=1 Tax=Nostoc sp. KVJ20 TaxID=457944 RepID=UPI00083DD988|nr:hypothetical protein [Nostoc sp. KVJ20]ODG99985.1 hypothetical protein A4S05_35480 [Nostoc sp. KVJ20]
MLQIIRREIVNAALFLTVPIGAILIGVDIKPAFADCNPFGCSPSSVAECNPFGCPNAPLGQACTPFGCPQSPPLQAQRRDDDRRPGDIRRCVRILRREELVGRREVDNVCESLIRNETVSECSRQLRSVSRRELRRGEARDICERIL